MTLGNSPQQAVIAFLKTLGIDINLVSYPAHSMVEAGRSLRGDMPRTFTKNLFLKDKKGCLFLVVAEEAWSITYEFAHRVWWRKAKSTPRSTCAFKIVGRWTELPRKVPPE